MNNASQFNPGLPQNLDKLGNGEILKNKLNFVQNREKT